MPFRFTFTRFLAALLTTPFAVTANLEYADRSLMQWRNEGEGRSVLSPLGALIGPLPRLTGRVLVVGAPEDPADGEWSIMLQKKWW